MKRLISSFFILLISSTFVFAGNCLCPGEKMKNGWCWPTGTSSIGNYVGWHDGNPDYPGSKHLGQDIKASEDDGVYSISSGGYVVEVRNDVNYYGGMYRASDGSTKGIKGGGVIVQYKEAGGDEFTVVYAHLKNIKVSKGETLNKGQKIGEIRDYTAYRRTMNHLHFGIRFPANEDSNRWAGYGSTDKGFVNPLYFLEIHSPYTEPKTKEITFFYVYEEDVFGQEYGIGWSPADGACVKAKYFMINGQGFSSADNSICYEAFDKLAQMKWIMDGTYSGWRKMFFESFDYSHLQCSAN